MPYNKDIRRLTVSLSDNVDIGARLVDWNSRWSMMGDFVVCDLCIVSWSVDEAAKPFVHLPACSAVAGGLYPWRELADILSGLPPTLN